MLNLALFEETVADTQPEVQISESPEIALAEEKTTPNPTASSDEFYQKVREMKTRQHQSERELVELMAKRFGIAKNDYERIKTAINEDIAKGERADDISEKLKAWQEREADVKKLYPDFELAKELSNREFFNLCYNGVDVMTAYQVLHFDDIIMAAMRYAVSEMKRADIGNANGAGRAREGALDDSSRRMRQEKPKLTKKERNELIRRAERGETVRL